jgi:hypothetical protein
MSHPGESRDLAMTMEMSHPGESRDLATLAR